MEKTFITNEEIEELLSAGIDLDTFFKSVSFAVDYMNALALTNEYSVAEAITAGFVKVYINAVNDSIQANKINV